MAAFKNEKNGTWYVQFRYTDWQGLRQQKLKRGFATKREAQEWERAFLTEKKADVTMPFKTFTELYEKDVRPKLDNFMNCCLADSIEIIFKEINKYIFEQEQVDTEHIYIDGTKLEANANKYSWVWKKSSIKNRNKTFVKVSALLEEINKLIAYQGVRFDIRTEYAVEYMEEITANYIRLVNINPEKLVRGRGRRKTTEQRYYEKLTEYTEKLKKYAEHIRISGEHRNSYSKTDNGATFFRMKKDNMGNDRLLPGYNIQLGLCDEYIAVYDVKQYASDMDCFQPLMEKFKDIYHKYPQCPVADAGYGSFNNYLYCEKHGMGKYMKFTMFKKETEDKKYRENPYRAVNFYINENGNPECPNGKEFRYLYSRPVRGNQFGRTEELYQCEDCPDCQLKEQCCKCEGNRIVRIQKIIRDSLFTNLGFFEAVFLQPLFLLT